MRIARVGAKGEERPAILDQRGQLRDLSVVVPDASPAWLINEGPEMVRSLDLDTLPVLPPDARIGQCVPHVGKVVCVGLNYSDHALETGQPIPVEPILFLKGGHTVQGPNDPVTLPRGSKKSDWEVELAVVVGRRASYVSESEALNYVAGYAVFNDLSEREYQLERGGQWDKGKNCATFGPLGPWIVTKDEVPNAQNLKIWLDVNGRRFQNGSTSTMIFTVPFLVHYISQFMPLEPGDIISTGTPPGVGLGQKPPLYLKVGDRMEVGIEGLGLQQQVVMADAQGA